MMDNIFLETINSLKYQLPMLILYDQKMKYIMLIAVAIYMIIMHFIKPNKLNGSDYNKISLSSYSFMTSDVYDTISFMCATRSEYLTFNSAIMMPESTVNHTIILFTLDELCEVGCIKNPLKNIKLGYLHYYELPDNTNRIRVYHNYFLIHKSESVNVYFDIKNIIETTIYPSIKKRLKLSKSCVTMLSEVCRTNGRRNPASEINVHKTFDNIFLSKECEIPISNILTFNTRREFYEKTGIPYKLVYLLHGPPGCGKSSIAYAASNITGKKIHFVNIKTFNMFDMYDLYSVTNKIICFEEIDTIPTFNKRTAMTDDPQYTEHTEDAKDTKNTKNTRPNDCITLGNILEFLDGYHSLSDCIVILTTNHIHKIDPAVYRHGRVDHVIEMKKCNKYQLEKIFKYYYNVDINNEPALNDFNYIDYTMSVAEIIHIIIANIHNFLEASREISHKSKRISAAYQDTC